MIILPAIDLIEGKCVRLNKGLYEEKTIYEQDPIKMAKKIQSYGADYLHIIDLDRALRKGNNEEVIKEVLKELDLPIQVGGGIRSESILAELLEVGVSRVILGTRAIKDPDWAMEMLDKFGDKICISLDAIGQDLKVSGWLDDGKKDIFKFLEKIDRVSAIIYTDISRDGMLTGPNLPMLEKIRKRYKGFLMAAGGIQGVEDFPKLEAIGVDGVIVGKALYENRISMDQIKNWRKYE